MNESGQIAATIRAKLTSAFAPSSLSVEDESAHHAGHAGARPGGETHFRVHIVSSAFAGLSRVERQRRVYQVLSGEIAGGVHALALTTLTPEEARRSD
jgi:BolA family transcriptional regulator, general stress-responsive regulator